MVMKKLAFITSSEDPALVGDDRLAIPPLKLLGFEVAPLVWDLDSEFTHFDALIFRSCWNYHRKFDAFQDWLKTVEMSGVLVLNPIEISRWNLNKRYLLELARKGVRVPKTQIIPRGTASWDLEIMANEYVVKPAVSLNGHDTYRAQTHEIPALVDELRGERDVLIQEYMPEIKSAGEISFTFFNNKFSHAVRKLPSQEEFRIHSEYGGTKEVYYPGEELLKEVQLIVEAIGQKLLFCRVDVVLREGKPYLIEFEIIDPMLYLFADKEAPKRFAMAIQQCLAH